MIIKSIEMLNFRQYLGRNKIVFSTDKDKNVTIIKGENGAGKTTLLEAFTWCLYGELNLPNKQKLITTEVDNTLKIGDAGEVFVELNFIHNNDEYIVLRKCEFVKNINGTISKKSKDCKVQRKKQNGALEPLDESELEKIVPADLARYFFFDGERIENITKINREGKKDLNIAIRNILGLSVITNAKKHLKEVVKSFENDFKNDANNELNSLKEEKIRLEKKLDEKVINREDCKEEIEIIDENIKDIDEKLKGFKDLRVFQKEREEKSKQLSSNDLMIENIKNDIKVINKRSLPEFLAQKVLGLCKEQLDLEILENKGIIGIDGSAIDDLIKRGKCVCGQCLDKGTEYYETLIKQKEFQPPASLSSIINQFNEKINKTHNDANEYKKDIKEKMLALEKAKYLSEDLRDDITSISEKLVGTDKAKELEVERKALIEDKDKNNEKLIRLNLQIEELDKEIKRKESRIEALALDNSENNIIRVRKEYTKKLIEAIDDFYNRKEATIKCELNNKVKEIFSELLCTNHKIEIMDDYTFKICDIDGEESTSQGQDVITSFAFIAGIIDLAKRNHKQIEVDEPYPLIMDAPFAKLSKTHRRNVAKLLPNIAEQFILITVDSQYEGDIEETLKFKIGYEYSLEMSTEGKKYTEIVKRG